ncbi:hypothetical protein, partial [Mesorhizobium sp. M0965]|uniref:hypothetical protein n=1 Tax=Mesorhizobium sp. M0965 TaxID=2957036 RepID=UPI0033354222
MVDLPAPPSRQDCNLRGLLPSWFHHIRVHADEDGDKKGTGSKPGPFLAFCDLDQFIVGMTNSAPSFTPARAPAAEARTRR